MSEWLSLKENPPEGDIVAVVSNENGWMWHAIASYIKASNVWVLKDPLVRVNFLLDVTHYVEIPTNPPKNITQEPTCSESVDILCCGNYDK